MLLIDEHFDAGGHWNAAAGRAAGADPFHRLKPRHDRTSDSAPTSTRRAKQGEVLRWRKTRAECARGAAFDEIAGKSGEFLDHRFQGGAFHLSQLDGQHLQEMSVRIDRGGSPPIRWAHQPACYVEADRALTGSSPCRRVDRHYARSVQNTAGQGGEVAETPRREAAVLTQGGQWI